MKIIIDHYMTENPDIPRRLHKYYRIVENDEVVKLIFNSRKNKEDVPTTHLQPIVSTQETHRTLSAPMIPNPNTTEGKLSASRKPTPRRFGTRLESRIHKESLEVKKTANVLIIHDDGEEEESAKDALIQRNGDIRKGIEEIRDTPHLHPLDPLGLTLKDCKTLQGYPDVPTTSKRISLRSMDSFQGLTPKRALPSDMVKNPKLNVNPTTLVLVARSYLTEDPQCSTHIHGLINTIITHPNKQSNSYDSLAEEEEREREGDPIDINTIAYNEE
uniref:Uncharacterized protein n=1 Tax=Tanacetum cinerariifolium TaxID=118510 RepID=A0A6L2NMK8_TANCI|nr:hypothetical protein [Tanacetum cinerariifolium]